MGELLIALAPEFLIMLLLLCCSAFFAAAETALFSLTSEDVRRISLEPSRKQRAIQSLLRDPQALLASILFGNMLINISLFGLSFLVSLTFARNNMHFAATAVGVGSLLALIIFGETSPKGIAVSRPVPIARLTAVPIHYFFRLTTPVAFLLRRCTGAATEFFTRHFPTDPYVTPSEFKALVALGEQQGTLDRQAREMIEQVVELTNLRARDVMIPRVDIPMFNMAAGREGLVELVSMERVERMLAYNKTADNIVGMIFTRDVFVHPQAELRSLLRPVRFVPESQPVDALLRHFQQAKDSLVVVVDEYGGTAGLVTLEDILEEIVGEIRPEEQRREPSAQMVDDDTYVLPGDANVRDWRSLLNIGFDPAGIDTLGGLIMSLLGRVPKEGDRIERRGLRMTVEKMRGRRVARVRVERLRRGDQSL